MRSISLIFGFTVLSFFFSCKKGSNSFTDGEQQLFTLMPSSDTNIDFANIIEQSASFNCLKYSYVFNGGGVAIGDVNNDGLQDIYMTANLTGGKLYLNKGDFEFEDVTTKANVASLNGWTTGTSMVDINNDGWLDIYVCKSASLEDNEARLNQLFINKKDGTFEEQARLYGLADNGFSIQSYFFDYDKDGDLDMYLVNHRVDFENTLRIEKNEFQKKAPETSDHLYRNDGEVFTDVTEQSKIINKAWGLSASIGDFNNDGWLDIYVANDYIMPDFLYINNHDGTFTNELNNRFKHISYNSMGSDFADINNDFLPDLMVLEMSAEDHIRSKENMASMNTEGFEKIINSEYNLPYMANVLQLNNGNGTFSDIGQLTGMSKTDWSWAPLIADFDNDGYKDVFVTNGIDRNFSNQDYIKKLKKNIDNKVDMTINQVIEMMPSEKIANYSFKNNGDLSFTNTTKNWGLDKLVNSNGVAYADLDNDGDLDLVVNNISEVTSVYRNNANANYLKIKLVGTSKNLDGLGAKVKVFTKNSQQYQELYTNRGYQSSNSNILNFGLGNEDQVTKIEVVWDNGKTSILENESANQLITIDNKDAVKTSVNVSNKTTRINEITPAQLGIDFVHKENIFNDFSKQVLLPQKYSQQGPALSVADVNNDGLEDFFIGGAKDQAASLYIQNKSGKFDRSAQPAFEKDKAFEDIKSLFFDANGDGYKDLYVTSGGYEFPENSFLLQDRLYVNDTKGKFIKSANLPVMLSNTKAVTAVDYDKDGDLDLAVGGHCVSGKYPLASNSYILQNNKGVFMDVTKSIAEEFSQIGLVNDLLFSDYDQDGDSDLIVVGEWMPITIFSYKNGKFSKTNLPLYQNTNGWWNTVAQIDIDKDGDLDYFFGNLGDNNKFHPTKEKPLHVYGNNFDDNETYDMVLSKLYKGRLVPTRGKECSSQQNSFVSEKTPTYKSFANSTMSDIYGKDKINASYHKEVYEFASTYAINNGKGSYALKNLPKAAQIGPTQSFAFYDVNKDGYLDILGMGGIYETEVETIRYDANIGYVLVSDAKVNLKSTKEVDFYNDSNAKQMKTIIIAGKTYMITANNNDKLKIFKIN